MKKGFTLIELLAVILVLGIIALVAVPTIHNAIDEARMGTFKVTVSETAKVAEEYCQVQLIKNMVPQSQIIIANNRADVNLNMKGQLPNKGYINIDNNCGITLAVSDIKYCAIKEEPEGEILIGKTVNNKCKLENYEYPLEKNL